MELHLIDYILLAIIAAFTWIGLWSGFIHTLGSFLGVFLGVALSTRYYEVLAQAWNWLFFGNETTAKIVVFIVLFILISRAVGVAFWLLNKIFNVVKWFPFLSSINRIAGAMLGFLEGVLIVAVVLFLIIKYPVSQGLLDQIANSPIAQILIKMVAVVKPLIPEALKNITQFGK